MVGHLGEEASASIGLVGSTIWLMVNLLLATAMGFSVQVAHFIGANSLSQTRQVFRQGLACGIAVSILLTLIAIGIHQDLPYWLGGKSDIAVDSSRYFLIHGLAMPFLFLYHISGMMLKSAGNMRIPSMMAVLLCLTDIAFNHLFINILGFGVMGAAIGTVLAYICVSLILFYKAAYADKLLNLRQEKEQFHWQREYLHEAYKISLPLAIQNVLLSGAQVVTTVIVASLGNIAIAAHNFANTAESLCYLPGFGIGDAATTLVGQTLGADRKDLCKSFAHMTVGLGMVVMGLMGVVTLIFAPNMMNILSSVDGIQELGTTCLRIEAFVEPFYAASIVTYRVFVGTGDTKKPVIMNVSTIWFVRLTLAYVLSKDYGLEGVWIAMAIELVLRGVLFLIRLYQGTWMRKSRPIRR